MEKEPIYVNLEFTPNPNSLKFSINRNLISSGTANFTNPADAEDAPLAKSVFGISGIEAVMIGSNFVTITKAPDGNWDTIADEVPQTIETHLSEGKPIFLPNWKPVQKSSKTPSKESEGEIETKIKEILDSEIRPAVAMDGGDIVFDRYEEGIVYLHMQGACSSCPSSVLTLKSGVETRLRESIPQIKEVVQI